jgi:hypothetical protein
VGLLFFNHRVRMKVIFLDIDGVLNNNASLLAGAERGDYTWTHKCWDPTCVLELKRLLDVTDARIVVSSTWRLYPGQLQTALTAHRDIQAATIGVTDDLYMPGEERTLRGQEIQAWLDTSAQVETYVILDDDSDMKPSQLPFFVQTSMATGLTKEHVDRAIEILGPEE